MIGTMEEKQKEALKKLEGKYGDGIVKKGW